MESAEETDLSTWLISQKTDEIIETHPELCMCTKERSILIAELNELMGAMGIERFRQIHSYNLGSYLKACREHRLQPKGLLDEIEACAIESIGDKETHLQFLGLLHQMRQLRQKSRKSRPREIASEMMQHAKKELLGYLELKKPIHLKAANLYTFEVCEDHIEVRLVDTWGGEPEHLFDYILWMREMRNCPSDIGGVPINVLVVSEAALS